VGEPPGAAVWRVELDDVRLRHGELRRADRELLRETEIAGVHAVEYV
jgi:hypothetical protein